MWETGGRIPTQFNNGCARCFCAAEIAIAGTDQHIYAAHYRRRFRRAQTCRNHQRQPKSCRPHLYRESQCGLYQIKGSSTEYKAGLERAVAKGWLRLHESGTYVWLTATDARKQLHRRGAAQKRNLSVWIPKTIGLARSASPDSPLLLERISSGVRQARRYSIGIRGKRADLWSPHTVRSARMSLGRGVPCRDIVASSHGLSCKCGCSDQRGRHEGQFGHLFLHMVAEAKEAPDSLL